MPSEQEEPTCVCVAIAEPEEVDEADRAKEPHEPATCTQRSPATMTADDDLSDVGHAVASTQRQPTADDA